VAPAESGFIVEGDVKNMKLLDLPKGGKIVVVAINNEPVTLFKLK
jgi:hypothetical protein